MTLAEFNTRLQDVFGGRLRARWSDYSRSYHIEQKVGRGVFDPPTHRDHRESDRWIRARDGYSHVMEIRVGDRMACPTCHLPVDVPTMELAETRCLYCKLKGRDTTFVACYFPLGETLIDHLRKIDPENDGIRRQAAEIERNQRRAELSRERAADGALRDGLMDAAIDQIPKWGYGGMKRLEAGA